MDIPTSHPSGYDAAETPLPRGAGADAPQSPRSRDTIPLEYTEQNFNALVAANTAMQTALADNEQQMGAQAQRIMELRDGLEQLRGIEDRFDTALNKQHAVLNGVHKTLSDEKAAHEHTKALLAAANLRLERSKGYIDRVLDDEARLSDPEKIVRPVPRPPIGPGLGDIMDPPAPRRDGDSDWMRPSSMLRASEFMPEQQQRRY